LENERKILNDEIFDLRLENDVLKERIVKEQDLQNDDDLLCDLPLMRHEEEKESDRRVGCLWRFGKYFKGAK
jgi:hypothetical protein